MMIYDIGTTVYFIKSKLDELPRINEWLVAATPQAFEEFDNYVYAVPPNQVRERRANMFWRSELLIRCEVTDDKAVATQWLLDTIDECITGLESDIETLRKYRAEMGL